MRSFIRTRTRELLGKEKKHTKYTAIIAANVSGPSLRKAFIFKTNTYIGQYSILGNQNQVDKRYMEAKIFDSFYEITLEKLYKMGLLPAKVTGTS